MAKIDKDIQSKIDSLTELFIEGLITEDELIEKTKLLKSKENNTNSQSDNLDNKQKQTSLEGSTTINTTRRSADSKPLVEISNLTKQYKGRKEPAIQNISFNIYPGDFHVFIGANGAGKTTTIKSIIGAYSSKKFNGEIKIGGYSNQTVEGKKLIGYIPEKAVFPKKMSTKDYLISLAMLSGYKMADAKKKIEEVLKAINMEQFANKCPNDFSSGQKKKILLAQCLLSNPQVLIMDEPAANLDPIAREELFETLLSLQKKGKAIFLSSHILDEVGKYATHVTILDGGKIVHDGDVDKKTNLTSLYKQFVKFGSVDNFDK